MRRWRATSLRKNAAHDAVTELQTYEPCKIVVKGRTEDDKTRKKNSNRIVRKESKQISVLRYRAVECSPNLSVGTKHGKNGRWCFKIQKYPKRTGNVAKPSFRFARKKCANPSFHSSSYHLLSSYFTACKETPILTKQFKNAQKMLQNCLH